MDDVGYLAVSAVCGPLVLVAAQVSCGRLGGGPLALGVGLGLIGVTLGVSVFWARGAAWAPLQELMAGVLALGSVLGTLWVRVVCG